MRAGTLKCLECRDELLVAHFGLEGRAYLLLVQGLARSFNGSSLVLKGGGKALLAATGFVLGREAAGILDPLQPCVRQVLREALRVRRLEEAVLARPGDQRRLVELPQPVGTG
jgi:hypothetical protein